MPGIQHAGRSLPRANCLAQTGTTIANAHRKTVCPSFETSTNTTQDLLVHHLQQGPFPRIFPDFSRCFWAQRDSSDSVLSNGHLPRPMVPKNRGWDEEMSEGRPGCGEETRFTACHADAAAAWGRVTDVTFRDSRRLCHGSPCVFPSYERPRQAYFLLVL